MSATVLLALAAALASPEWASPEWAIDLDVRLVDSNGQRSVINGGLGTLRFDDTQSGLKLGRARFALSETFGQAWSLHVDASSWGDHDKNPVDLTEAYLQFRPYPFAGGYRFVLKTGAFYAPISLENRSSGWESPYTLSYSAINTWLGQELRTIGAEGQIDWLGTRTGHAFDVALTGGVFGWNDPAGVVIASRGFSLSDRQTTLFGRVGANNSSPLPPMELFAEIDHRAGFYAGLEGRYYDRVVIRALHYDNRGDPEAVDAADHYAWNTHFNSVGIRAESGTGWTAIAQYLDGETAVEDEDDYLTWPFRARFALISKEMGHHRISLRYDSFAVEGESDYGGGAQHGHAWTAAYVYEPGAHWRFTLEWLRVASDNQNRPNYVGLPPRAVETQVQLAVRFALGPLAR